MALRGLLGKIGRSVMGYVKNTRTERAMANRNLSDAWKHWAPSVRGVMQQTRKETGNKHVWKSVGRHAPRDARRELYKHGYALLNNGNQSSVPRWTSRHAGGKSARYGKFATGAGITFVAASAVVGFGKGALDRMRATRKQSFVGSVMAGRGYASWVPGRSGGMSPEHLGASGGLALNLHKMRHRA